MLISLSFFFQQEFPMQFQDTVTARKKKSEDQLLFELRSVKLVQV